jgi:hypothetical protein
MIEITASGAIPGPEREKAPEIRAATLAFRRPAVEWDRNSREEAWMMPPDGSYRLVLHGRNLRTFTIRESEFLRAKDLIGMARELRSRWAAKSKDPLRLRLEDGADVCLNPDVIEYFELFDGSRSISSPEDDAEPDTSPTLSPVA